MKNITVTVEDDLYRRARVRAAEEGTTVSAVVKTVLRAYAKDGSVAEARAAELRALYDRVDGRLKGEAPVKLESGWRDRLYDERFEKSGLGRSLAARR